jgi:predicted TIM-barrel fold metal-dependent hydrolase
MLKIFDGHFHIIEPRFPLVPNQSYLPPEFTCADYLKRVQYLHVVGGAVVSGSFQAFDQTYLLAALKELGPSFVGVTQLPMSVTDEEILRLSSQGVRAVRFNIKRGGSETIDHIEYFAKKIYEIAGWHVEIYIDSKELDGLSETLLKLPSVSIDHLGLSKKGFSSLLSLVEKGVKVKVSGFGRVDFDVREALKAIAHINPEAMIFGTDLPSTRAPRPFLDQDIQLILDTFDDAISTKILYSNGISFYKLNI